MLASIEKLRDLAADINGNEIIDHMQLYPSCVFDGHWLDSWHMEFDRALDSIEREIAERYMELPADADGVPVHIGDTLYIFDDSAEVTVTLLSSGGFSTERPFTYSPSMFSHAKPDPLKELLNDHLQEREKIVRKLESSLITLDEAESEEDACDKLFAERTRELLGGDAE